MPPIVVASSPMPMFSSWLPIALALTPIWMPPPQSFSRLPMNDANGQFAALTPSWLSAPWIWLKATVTWLHVVALQPAGRVLDRVADEHRMDRVDLGLHRRRSR
jgi:hypothetical protein